MESTCLDPRQSLIWRGRRAQEYCAPLFLLRSLQKAVIENLLDFLRIHTPTFWLFWRRGNQGAQHSPKHFCPLLFSEWWGSWHPDLEVCQNGWYLLSPPSQGRLFSSVQSLYNPRSPLCKSSTWFPVVSSSYLWIFSYFVDKLIHTSFYTAIPGFPAQNHPGSVPGSYLFHTAHVYRLLPCRMAVLQPGFNQVDATVWKGC